MFDEYFVLDTSVLLSDPLAMFRFAGANVVIPLVVVQELEAKRSHPDIGHFARRALHTLEEIREADGASTFIDALSLGTSGEFLIIDPDLEESARNNDAQIIACALRTRHRRDSTVTLVTQDLPMRILAGAQGIEATDYKENSEPDKGYTGFQTVDVDAADIDALFKNGNFYGEYGLRNSGIIFKNGRQSAIGMQANGQVNLIRDNEVFGVRARSVEQKFAIDLLTDPEILIASIGGRAGTGKSALALCAGLEAVLEKGKHKKVVVFRPLYAVGGQTLGFLPGSEAEKMGPWAEAVFDTLGALVEPSVIDEVLERGMLEVLPLTHIRGRSLHDAFVIVDEAQSLEKNVLLTVLSRIGQNSKVVLTHDVAQRDNLRVGRYNGVASVIEALKGQDIFGHITLNKSERSAVAELVTTLLDD